MCMACAHRYVDGYAKPSQLPGKPSGAPVDISVDFRSVPGLAAAGGRKVRVTDVWSGMHPMHVCTCASLMCMACTHRSG